MIDASIYSQIRAPEQQDSLAKYAQVQSIQNAQNQSRLADLAYGEKQRERADTDALNDAHKIATKNGVLDRQVLYDTIAQRGLGSKLPGMQETFAKADKEAGLLAKAQADKQKTDIENHLAKFGVIAQVMNGVSDQATFDAAKQEIGQKLGPEAVAQMPDAYDPAAIQANMQKAMSVKDQLEAKWKQLNDDTQRRSQDMTAKTAAEKLAEEKRNNNMKDRRSKDANGIAQNTPQYMETEQGLMALPKKLPNGQTPTAIQVMGLDGQPMQRKLKDLPAPIQKALMENNSSLRKVDQALALVESKPDSFGVKNYLGDAIRQRTDPGGVEARAFAADIGSLLIHDRSGAAVTASETPRLQPFIPTATDNPDTVKKKLKRFKQEYEAINNDITTTYTREAGYRQPGSTTAARATPAAPQDQQALDWANANPKDPRAAQIRQRLGQ